MKIQKTHKVVPVTTHQTEMDSSWQNKGETLVSHEDAVELLKDIKDVNSGDDEDEDSNV